jgi:hypothetical protein
LPKLNTSGVIAAPLPIVPVAVAVPITGPLYAPLRAVREIVFASATFAENCSVTEFSVAPA